MMGFPARANLAEYIDDPALPAADYAAAMAGLEMVNRVLHAYAPTFRFLKKATKGMASFRLIDAGSGHGDYLRAIARWARAKGIAADLIGVDLSPASKAAAEAATPAGLPIRYVTADIFEYEPAEPVDFVVSSLFTHHLSDWDVVRFVDWMEQHAERGWHINDLQRGRLAWLGFNILGWVLRWHPIVRHDGAISVRRAFTRDDWDYLLSVADAPRGLVTVRWWPLFRYAVEKRP
jgi:2-polyprenyl-3-methyl-5-hydroxy-6-metoxy-1,4-benzoquinol methylase